MDNNSIEIIALEKQLEEAKKELVEHRIFSSIKTIEDLRIFMTWHVFAVWDFMSLAKSLQRSLTCTDLPWMPPIFPTAARFINEIVLGEESDLIIVDGQEIVMSHMDLYKEAMLEIGANSTPIQYFISRLVDVNKEDQFEILYETIDKCLGDPNSDCYLPEEVREFVLFTMNTAKYETLHNVLGAFFHGREDIIPEMFKQFNTEDFEKFDIKPKMFNVYIDRHIELDSGEHGPAVKKIIDMLVGESTKEEMLEYSITAIRKRIRLWDGINRLIELQK